MHTRNCVSVFALLFILAAPPAFGATKVGREFRFAPNGLTVPLSTGEQTFENSTLLCEQNDTCDLSRVIFRKEEYIIPATPSVANDETIQSTRMLVGMVTKSVPALTRYLFVQFTMGCMWFSSLDENLQLDTEFGVLRDYLGILFIQHVFPRWVVDTNDTDPAYATHPSEVNRHYFLQSADAIPTWIPDRQGKLYGEELPTIPFGYVTDTPGPAYYSPEHKTAVNMSLEFKTCLFKTIDVPLITNGVDVDINNAVVCFNWDSKAVFSHRDLVFKSPKGVHNECKRPFAVHEKKFHLRQLQKEVPDSAPSR